MICGDLVACPPVLSAVTLLEKTRKKKKSPAFLIVLLKLS